MCLQTASLLLAALAVAVHGVTLDEYEVIMRQTSASHMSQSDDLFGYSAALHNMEDPNTPGRTFTQKISSARCVKESACSLFALTVLYVRVGRRLGRACPSCIEGGRAPAECPAIVCRTVRARAHCKMDPIPFLHLCRHTYTDTRDILGLSWYSL